MPSRRTMLSANQVFLPVAFMLLRWGRLRLHPRNRTHYVCKWGFLCTWPLDHILELRGQYTPSHGITQGSLGSLRLCLGTMHSSMDREQD